MSDSEDFDPWSSDPYAPQIPDGLYVAEKAFFAGVLLSTIAYGITLVLFFKCMRALLNPMVRLRGNIKWALAAHTVAMFLCVTINGAANFDAQLTSYIDNREFPGDEEGWPGPYAYLNWISPNVASILSNVTGYLGQWLADGILLHRCWIIYGMNYWFIAFPCLMYLATIALGITIIYSVALPWNTTQIVVFYAYDLHAAYYSITLALNVLLTLMILARLFLHRRNVQKATGGLVGTNGVYKTVVVTLAESYAIYALNFIIFMGTWGAGSPLGALFGVLLSSTQIIAPLVTILRVANRTALTSGCVASGSINSIHFTRRGGSTNGDESLSGEDITSSTDGYAETQRTSKARAGTVVKEIPQ